MQSIDARRPSSQFEQHLFDARRRALSAGLRWYWVINLIALVFLLTRFYIYRDAHLVKLRVWLNRSKHCRKLHPPTSVLPVIRMLQKAQEKPVAATKTLVMRILSLRSSTTGSTQYSVYRGPEQMLVTSKARHTKRKGEDLQWHMISQIY